MHEQDLKEGGRVRATPHPKGVILSVKDIDGQDRATVALNPHEALELAAALIALAPEEGAS